ncbi:MAG: iron-sulfur cluster carrier protein ApbC [Alphaproteobacteria bacterium]
MAITEAKIKQLLSTLNDPLSGASLNPDQRLSGITIKHKMVQLSIDIENGSNAPKFDSLVKQMEDLIGSQAGVNNVTVLLTAEKKAGAPSQQAAPHQHQHAATQAATQAGDNGAGIGAVKHIIAVASGKGGVGKSTTAVNLAYALSKIGLSVGLLDADIYGPSLPKMLGKREAPRTADNKTMMPVEVHGIKTMSIGFVIDEEEPVIWRGPMVMGALSQMLKDVIWGELDLLVVDMPPGTGDAQLTLTQQVPLSGAVIVSTPQDIALLDARKGLNMFRKTDVPVLGLIENMAVFICPNCAHESHIFGHGGARKEAGRLGVPFLGEIPLEIDIRLAADQGHAIVLSAPESAHAKPYLDMAKQLHAALFAADQDQAKKSPTIRMT